MSLLKETLCAMEQNGKHPRDVLWVGAAKSQRDENYREGPPVAGSWEDFAAIADIEYDNGFGGAEINQALLVVGFGWWLERHEYDGSEWWEFKTLPVKPRDAGQLTKAGLLE